MGFARYLLRRLFWAVWLFFVATLITYVLFFMIPNDPARITNAGIVATPAIMKHVRSELHLDVPYYQQYWIFVWNIIRHQSLGYSYRIGAPVRWILGQDVRVTGSVILGGAVFWLLAAVPLGVLSALRPRSLFDRVSMIGVLAGISAPSVFVALILAYIFGFRLGWTPIADYCNFFPNSAGECSGPTHWAYHLILPWATYAILFTALYVRIIRSSVMEVANEDYIRTAWAKGASPRRVVIHHILRNSLLPVITMLGMDIGLAFSGSIFIEEVFNLHGVGYELIGGALTGDVPVVVGIVVFMCLAVIVCNFVVDVVYSFLDPRIRLT